jgi:hypothetical protein
LLGLLPSIYFIKFQILDHNKYNPLIILLYLPILGSFIIVFQLCSYKISLLEDYFLNKFTIYCDRDPDEVKNMNDKLKDNGTVFTDSLKSGSFGRSSINNNNNYINTPRKFLEHHRAQMNIKKLNNSNYINSYGHNPSPNVVYIREIKKINPKFLDHFISNVFIPGSNVEFDDYDYNNFLDKKGKSTISFQIDQNILNFVNENKVLIGNCNIPKQNLLEFVTKIYDIELEHKQNIKLIEMSFNKALMEEVRKDTNPVQQLNELRYAVYHGDNTNTTPKRILDSYMSVKSKIDKNKEDLIMNEVEFYKTTKLKKVSNQVLGLLGFKNNQSAI